MNNKKMIDKAIAASKAADSLNEIEAATKRIKALDRRVSLWDPELELTYEFDIADELLSELLRFGKNHNEQVLIDCIKTDK